ncbi:hypothetical protein GCM10009825_01920 [Arthrobacter humicola]|uniref:Uncharacterized protein n=1 Tax=Arthrobacter humicola TaxID=409291 RepID=A0ABP5K5R2_9MICC
MVEGCTVSPRKSRRKSACFSNTVTRTPARARSRPSIIPAGPPPTTAHPVFSMAPTLRLRRAPREWFSRRFFVCATASDWRYGDPRSAGPKPQRRPDWRAQSRVNNYNVIWRAQHWVLQNCDD